MSEDQATTPPRAAALALKVAADNDTRTGTVPGQSSVTFRQALQGAEDLERRLAATRAAAQAIAELVGANRRASPRARPDKARMAAAPIFSQMASSMLEQAHILAEIDDILAAIKDQLR